MMSSYKKEIQNNILKISSLKENQKDILKFSGFMCSN